MELNGGVCIVYSGSSTILSRYTHRVAIANSRLVAYDRNSVIFRWKDYRLDGRERFKTMTLATFEFIRRFLIHVLPSGFHRIRHYGLFASGSRSDNIARARKLLPAQPTPQPRQDALTDAGEPKTLAHPCPCCGGRMIVIERFRCGSNPRHWPPVPTPAFRIDSS
jgi:Putative transposase